MNTVADTIQQDMKAAMLSGDSFRTTVLRSLKSAILSAEVAQGKRATGLEDQEILAICAREAKKRQESADIYESAGDAARAEQERKELAIIQAYLPAQMSDDELAACVEAAIQEVGSVTQKDMGRIIQVVREKAAGTADGGRIARAVKERIG